MTIEIDTGTTPVAVDLIPVEEWVKSQKAKLDRFQAETQSADAPLETTADEWAKRYRDFSR